METPGTSFYILIVQWRDLVLLTQISKFKWPEIEPFPIMRGSSLETPGTSFYILIIQWRRLVLLIQVSLLQRPKMELITILNRVAWYFFLNSYYTMETPGTFHPNPMKPKTKRQIFCIILSSEPHLTFNIII